MQCCDESRQVCAAVMRWGVSEVISSAHCVMSSCVVPFVQSAERQGLQLQHETSHCGNLKSAAAGPRGVSGTRNGKCCNFVTATDLV